ncbi:HlyD family secretion protein [Pseudomonas yamanorum]|uniref:HlyD family secretion protein n=1 Tax=Pseudomonas yamanorum TaxID=515393 RepID=UPI002ED5EA6A|nr:HlyD family efflux transporter periplasmic adaptor subunit [Pseudomonas yamanorum]
MPASGQVKVYAPQPGVVLKRFVQEGQAVRQGDPLYSISSERYSASAEPVQAGVSRQLGERADSLRDQVSKQKQLNAEERKSLVSKVASLQERLQTLTAQAANQRALVNLVTDAAGRYQGLMDKGYISMDQLQQRQSELLSQKQSLQRLDSDRAALQQELAENRSQLVSIDARHANQLAELTRQLAMVEQDLGESEAKRTLLIRAPQSGVATALLAEAGQAVETARPLVNIVPADSLLRAELYAPSKAVGFIKEGDSVLIRYQAYPYQKFGQYRATVQSVSRTTLSSAELASMAGGVPGLGQGGEQFYRILVALEGQQVLAYGKARPLQSGMLLDADIMQDTRRLYEWVLEPLYSLTGKL